MTDWTEGVSVIVPTYKRPKGLERALKSLCEQSVDGRIMEIVIADNDPAGSAREFVTSFASKCAHDVTYKHVPNPGVSNARNGGLSVARGRFIAFLDDDMEALPGWVAELVAASLKYEAGLVFGPAIAEMPDANNPYNPYMIPFFSRTTDAPEGYITKTFGTGGCLVDLSICNIPTPAFDAKYNETGGEDDAFFHHLITHGSKVAWAPKAKSWEIVPAKRAVPDYMWQRNFAFGQSPTQEAADRGVAGIFEIAKWMSVGAAQFAINAPLMMAFKALGKPKYIHYHARTAQALGKICWWSGFKQSLYGANATTEDPVTV